MSALEPAVAYDFLGVDRRELGVRYRYTVCTPDPSPIDVGGMPVLVERGLDAIRRADTVLIPGWCSSDRRPRPELMDALRRAHTRGARLVSFCTGAIALAEAGLLDGRRATTHWEFGPEFRTRYPAVDLDESVLYVDEGQILTSAGVAASIDLALHLVRCDFGAEVANALARHMVVAPHRQGGQAQYIDAPIDISCDDDRIAATIEWAMARLGDTLTVAELASQASLSPRQFSRQFRARTGTSPHQWLLVQRTALAQRLLETTQLSVDRVATDAGFGTAAALRLHFQRTLKTSPVAYRRTFTCEREAG
jgi:AraC family transcriptional activator FtrA